MASPVKWEPACLTFPVAIGKPSVQQLRAVNSTDSAFTFKVKTTNPKRYSVRPNVGIVWPGQDVTVTVQLSSVDLLHNLLVDAWLPAGLEAVDPNADGGLGASLSSRGGGGVVPLYAAWGSG